ITGELPREQREVKGRDLCTALVDLQTMNIVAQYRIDRELNRQILFGYAQAHEQFRAGDKKMPGPAARIEHFQFGKSLRPSSERARGRSPRAFTIITAHES